MPIKAALAFIRKTRIRGTDVNSLTEWDIKKRLIKGSAKPVTHLHRPLVKIITSKLDQSQYPKRNLMDQGVRRSYIQRSM